MFGAGFYDEGDMSGMFEPGIMGRRPLRRFDEYYRCYPVVMLPGPERANVNHGGKVIMPPSALDKLTRLHITYPMLFELLNGAKDKKTHAGVLEFIAEEGKIYLPYWIMQTLLLEPGDLLQIKSTDLPDGRFIKLQAQSTSFLDISDPKAVLENAFRNFSCLTKGDVFTFEYNDQTYEMAVLEVKPETSQHAVSVLETDIEVDFAPPVGYEEPVRTSGTSTPQSISGGSKIGAPGGGMLHSQGTMAQAINYAAIAPSSKTAAAGAKAVSSNFLLGGRRLNSRKESKPPTPKPSTPVAGVSTNSQPKPFLRKTDGPQPLRLPPNKLFFGYEIKPVKKDDKEGKENVYFKGEGQSLRDGKRKAFKSDTGKGKEPDRKNPGQGRTLGGRTLRDGGK